MEFINRSLGLDFGWRYANNWICDSDEEVIYLEKSSKHVKVVPKFKEVIKFLDINLNALMQEKEHLDQQAPIVETIYKLTLGCMLLSNERQ